MKNDRKALNKFFKYLVFAKKEYIIGGTIMIIGAFLSSYSNYIIAKIFDSDYKNAFNLIKIFIIISIIVSIFEYLKIYCLIKASNIMYKNMQIMIYDHIQKLKMQYFDDVSAGSIVSRVIGDVQLIKDFFENTLVQVITIIVKLLSIYVILFYVNYKMAIALILFLIFMMMIKNIYEKIIIRHVVSYRKINSSLTGITNESLQNLDIIKAFNKEDVYLKKWEELSLERINIGKKIVKTDAKFLHNLTSLSRDILFIITLLIYAYSVFSNKNIVGAGMVYLFVRYTLDIISQVTNLVITLSNYSKALGAAANLNDILNLEPEHEKNDYTKNTILKSNIRFENVSFKYKEDGTGILNDISFEIKENKTAAFIGRTGSGKSTIMSLISKFYTIQEGNIYIGDININDINKKNLRENQAIVLQDPFLFEGTIAENILIDSNDENKARKILKELGAEFLIKKRPLHTKIEANGTNLSEGEKQLITFARALAKDPKILILDEATANVDSETEEYIGKALEKLKRNRTTLIIAHRLSTIKNADVIFVLDKGKIVEEGSHDELINKKGLYEKMYNSQK